MVAQGNSSDAPPCAILSRPRSWCLMISRGGRSWRACHIIPFMTQEAMDTLPHNPQGVWIIGVRHQVCPLNMAYGTSIDGG